MLFKRKNIGLWVLALLFVLPIISLFFLSFSREWQYPFILPKSFSLENWSYLFSNQSNIGTSLMISLTIALTVATFATFLGFITSRYIAYHNYRKQLLMLTYFPFALSPVIFALCLKYYFIKLDLIGNIPGIMLAQLIIAFPYSVIFFVGFWNQRVKQYQDLVATLGGNNSQAFFKIVMPLAKSLILVCFFQCFLISWFEFGLTSVIGYGKVETLTIKVFQFINEANIFFAALSCCLLILPPVILLWINKKFIIQQTK
ncbi:ABC transporter permease subunit [Pelobium sp.]|nr:ABC transporter permease subunit [Pelobium sp.]MDA9555705.1 ABC transporter permease subunit [Pelobium sp.]